MFKFSVLIAHGNNYWSKQDITTNWTCLQQTFSFLFLEANFTALLLKNFVSFYFHKTYVHPLILLISKQYFLSIKRDWSETFNFNSLSVVDWNCIIHKIGQKEEREKERGDKMNFKWLFRHLTLYFLSLSLYFSRMLTLPVLISFYERNFYKLINLR
jgi:hypothetical protein